MDEEQEFLNLPLPVRIAKTTSSQLLKHLRGLEKAGILPREEASKLIGCVKKLTSLAIGDGEAIG